MWYHKLGFFFFLNNTHFQTIFLVSIISKLFMKLTSNTWGRNKAELLVIIHQTAVQHTQLKIIK